MKISQSSVVNTDVLHIYSAMIRFDLRFTGLRYYMHNWFYTFGLCAIVFMSWIIFGILVVSWFVLRSWFGSIEEEETIVDFEKKITKEEYPVSKTYKEIVKPEPSYSEEFVDESPVITRSPSPVSASTNDHIEHDGEEETEWHRRSRRRLSLFDSSQESTPLQTRRSQSTVPTKRAPADVTHKRSHSFDDVHRNTEENKDSVEALPVRVRDRVAFWEHVAHSPDSTRSNNSSRASQSSYGIVSSQPSSFSPDNIKNNH